jgi:hypothetical protein
VISLMSTWTYHARLVELGAATLCLGVGGRRVIHMDTRVALITGASSGIGPTCATHLATCGARVYGTSRIASTGYGSSPRSRRTSRCRVWTMGALSNNSCRDTRQYGTFQVQSLRNLLEVRH